MTDTQLDFDASQTVNNVLQNNSLNPAKVMAVFGLLGSPLGLLPIVLFGAVTAITHWLKQPSLDGIDIEFIPITIFLFLFSYIFGILPSLLAGWMYWLTLKHKRIHLDYISSAMVGMLIGGACTLFLTILIGLSGRGFSSIAILWVIIGACAGLQCGLILTRLHRSAL